MQEMTSVFKYKDDWNESGRGVQNEPFILRLDKLQAESIPV